jgi:hypothetical protein
MTDEPIAVRRLLYTSRDSATPRGCTVGITAPRDDAPGEATGGDDAPDPLASCEVVFDGLPHPPIRIHGADTLQALALAADIDPLLRELEREQGFEFFWDDGSPYFAKGG